MNKFSSRSTKNLHSCHDKLKYLFDNVIERFDCTILEGHRTPEDQIRMFMDGKSKVRHGKHNFTPSRAVDAAPYPIQWNNLERFYLFGGFVMGVAAQLGVKIRWGGDWDGDKDTKDQSFNDLVHFELID